MSPERVREVRERFARAADELGQLDTSALASGETMPSERALMQARRMIGGLDSEGAARRVHRLASLLDELSELDQGEKSKRSDEAA
jgi:hypothetical protein